MNSVENESILLVFLESIGTSGWTLDDQGITLGNLHLSGYDAESKVYLNAGGYSSELTTSGLILFFLHAYSNAVTKETNE